MNSITRQKGAADSNPSKLKRWLLSQLMTHVISDARQTKERKSKESNREKQGLRRVVEYFHQVDDGYSHLTIQVLAKLMATYDIDLVVQWAAYARVYDPADDGLAERLAALTRLQDEWAADHPDLAADLFNPDARLLQARQLWGDEELETLARHFLPADRAEASVALCRISVRSPAAYTPGTVVILVFASVRR